MSTLPSRPGSALSGYSRPSSAASARSVGSYESIAPLRPPATAVEEWLREVNLGDCRLPAVSLRCLCAVLSLAASSSVLRLISCPAVFGVS